MTEPVAPGGAASLLLAGFSGTEMTDALRELAASGLLGVVLFSRNVESPEQVARLIRGLKEAAGRPFLIAVDQEGGAVRRLRAGFSAVPSMREVGAHRDPALAHEVGRLLGRELRSVGIDLNLAPVLDVDTNPDNPVIGARSFASDPAWVGALGVALGRGQEWEGVAACGKHFPGHGDTTVDSHRALPRILHQRERLDRVELAPFRQWIRAGLASIMTAHILLPALDPSRPATLSKAVLGGLLRGELGYQGAVLSDDLEMRAIVDHEGIGPASVLAVEAGVDILLVCGPAGGWREATRAIERARTEQPGFEVAFQASLARARGLAEQWARPAEPPALTVLASMEAEAVLARIRSSSAASELDPTEASARAPLDRT